MSEELSPLEKLQKFYNGLSETCENQQVQLLALQSQLTETITENYRLRQADRENVELRATVRELQSQISALRLRLEDQL